MLFNWSCITKEVAIWYIIRFCYTNLEAAKMVNDILSRLRIVCKLCNGEMRYLKHVKLPYILVCVA
jgi:hypothetical protein